MTIYISHSRNFDFKKELYQPIRNSQANEGHLFILPHEEDDTTLFPTKDLFESQQCELVIADVSFPSLGQGIELGWADLLHIPIVCIYKLDTRVPESLYTVSNKFIEYLNGDDMMEKIEKVLGHFEGN